MNGYFVHPSSFVDENVEIGGGTKIWHFCHIQSGARIGAKCSFGQNVNVSNNVIVGDGVKVQNNVSLERCHQHLLCNVGFTYLLHHALSLTMA